jgi:hypothetical protein
MDDLNKIINEISEDTSKKIDPITLREKAELECWKVESDKKRSELNAMEDDRGARKKYSPLMIKFVVSYICAVLVIYCAYQFTLVPHMALSRLPLSTGPIITLLTTTMANVISLLVIVMKYHYPYWRKYE